MNKYGKKFEKQSLLFLYASKDEKFHRHYHEKGKMLDYNIFTATEQMTTGWPLKNMHGFSKHESSNILASL